MSKVKKHQPVRRSTRTKNANPKRVFKIVGHTLYCCFPEAGYNGCYEYAPRDGEGNYYPVGFFHQASIVTDLPHTFDFHESKDWILITKGVNS